MPSTAELEHEIKTAASIEDYLSKSRKYMLTHSLPEHLKMLLSQKGLSKADVVRASLLDRSYVYQIFSGEKTPSRDKLIAIAFGLHLSDDETQKMLKLSGNRELYARDERDAMILFALHQKKSVFDVNELLFSHDLPVLKTSKM
ncbi:MAG: helix-turn-helix domain-containing protein [Lachnospiraceae bacterium]|nr:helix-turn-helix domain-containing protein [Lachnospiraceae bacterium]MDE6184950.1 helix-turn-helix domain-containing protein [Lachnospiraceae bacterium]